jgi:hypothetical protein
MKNFIALRAAWLGVVFLFAAVAAPAFEGRISLGFTDGKGREQVIDYAVKGTRVRLEPKMEQAAGTAMIMDGATQEMTVLMPAQRMYMVMPMHGVAKPGGTESPTQQQKVEKTGRTEKILGYDCEEYVMSDKGQSTEMWITDQLGSFMGLSGGNPMAGLVGGKAKAEASGWEQALKGKQGAFPLRVVSRDPKGKEIFRLEAKSVKPENLGDELFKAPEGFQKFSMPGMDRMSG